MKITLAWGCGFVSVLALMAGIDLIACSSDESSPSSRGSGGQTQGYADGAAGNEQKEGGGNLTADGAVIPEETGDGSSGQETSTGPQQLVVGVIQSLTGTDESLGKTLKNATEVAAQYINSVGGVNGKTLKFDIKDDASDKAKVGATADGFLGQADNVVGVLGATTSGNTMEIHQRFLDRKMLLISAGATTPALTTAQPAKDRYFFRTVPSGVLHGKVLAALAFRGPGGNRPCTNIASVFEDGTYGTPYHEQMKATFAKLGGSVSVELPIPKDKKASYQTEVAAIIKAHPGCVALVGYVDAAVQFVKDYRAGVAADKSGYDWSKVTIYGGNTLNTKDFVDKGRTDPADPSSPTVVEGVYGTNIDTAPQTSEFAYFKSLYKAAYNVDPPRNTANQFDAAILLALALQDAGGLANRVALRDALVRVSKVGTSFGPDQLSAAIAAIKRGEDIDYKGASGLVDFDDNGDISCDFLVWGVSQGAMTTVEGFKADAIPD